MGTTIIDSAWLAAPPGGDSGDSAHGWLLQRAGETYELGVDITALATGLIVGAADITVDLKGHLVTFNDAPPLSGTNWDFEADALGSATCTGWNFSGAPGSLFTIIGSATPFLFGSKCLQWRVPNSAAATPQTIESAPVNIPEAGRTYTASLCGSRVNLGSIRGQSIGLEVYDSVTRTKLANAIRRNGNLGQGEAAVITFLPTTTNPVYFVASQLLGSGTTDSICAIDRLRVTRSCDHGIIACEGSGASMNGGTGYNEARGAGVNTLSNLTVAAKAKFNKGRNPSIIDSTTARATATIDGSGHVTAVTITYGGSGYTTPPRVLFAGGGANDEETVYPARGTAVLSGGAVASITINDPGGPYLIPPGVIIEPRGAIRQGQARGAYCSPLAVHEQKGILTIDGVTLYANGDDVHVIKAPYGAATYLPGQSRTIRRNWIEHATDDACVTIRQNQIAAMYVAGGGPVEIDHNAIFDAPHTGIRGGSYAVGGDLHIHDFWMSPNVRHTNGYGAKLSGNGIRMLNGTIGQWNGTVFAPAESARGWLDEPEGDTMSDGVEIAYITADVYERGNREYGTTGTPTRVMRFRNLASNAKVTGRHYHHLSCTARVKADPEFNTQAVAARFNLTNWGDNDDMEMLVEDCILRAMIEGATDPGPNCHATSLTVDNMGGGMRPVFNRVRRESSEIADQLSGSDAASNSQVRDITSTESVFVKLSEGYTGRTFVSHAIGWTGTDVTNCNYYGNTYRNGAVHRVTYRHNSTKSVGFGERLTVHAMDGLSDDLAGVDVELEDSAHANAGSATTDAQGIATFDVLTLLYTGTTTPVITAKTPHSLTAQLVGYDGIGPPGPNSPLTIVLTSSPTTVDINMGTGETTPEGAFRFPAAEYLASTGGPFEITVTRQGSTAGAATVHHATGGGTATAGVDYDATSGDLSFADGDATKTFSVNVLALPMGSGDRTIGLALSSPSGGTLGTPSTATLVLVDQGAATPARRPSVIFRAGKGGIRMQVGGV